MTTQRIDGSADVIKRWLVSELASCLDVTATELAANVPFASYGIDSRTAVSVTQKLGRALGRSLPSTVFWAHPTIDDLAGFLASGEQLERQPHSPPRLETSPSESNEPIAIVGIGCRFPGAHGPQAFWQQLCDGVDAITEIPCERWRVDDHYSADRNAPGRMNTRFGGFLDQVDAFDAGFFGISSREARQMDPQQRLMLETSWEALEDAGIPPDQLRGSPTGVFTGVIWNDYAVLQHRAGLGAITSHSATGSHYSIVANRVSYALGLQGPSLVVDTACSSSLVAVHLACTSLWRGECDLALAGGVNLILAPDSLVAMSKLGALAPDGRSKAFDARADGYVRGEGAAVVVLKSLSRALRDGDRIYSLILGSAVNNDGFSNGLAAPNPEAQVDMLRRAYASAGRNPKDVHYVETHGTGTILGDPIEAGALSQVIGQSRPAQHPCYIGSVKTNIGHLEAAAGIAGLIKTALSIQQRQIPPSLNFTEPNPHIQFGTNGLEVQQALGAWPCNDQDKPLAGVSSFGFGGTNCHVVLEGLSSSSTLVVPLRAQTAASLSAEIEAWQRHIEAGETWAQLRDRASRLPASAPSGGFREAVVADSPRELSQRLARLSDHPSRNAEANRNTAAPSGPGLVFVFSGQGGQWSGMGQQLMLGEPVFRRALEDCDECIKQIAGWSVINELAAPPERQHLDRVDVVQPLLFALQVAQVALWRSWGIHPDAVIGHSMGEVAAAHTAGMLTLLDASRVICARSQLIRRQASGKGVMAVVDMSADELLPLLETADGRVSIAAENGPRTTVLSGEAVAVEQVLAAAAHQGRFHQLLKVDYASHSPAMDPLREELLEHLAGIRPQPPHTRFVSTATASNIAGASCGPAYWFRNLREPVRFREVVELLIDEGLCTFVEMGSHPVLRKSLEDTFVQKNTPGLVLASARRELTEHRAMLEAAATLYAGGVHVEWRRAQPCSVDPGREPENADANVAEEGVLLLSARSAGALPELARKYLDVARGASNLKGLCYTAALHRSHHEYRAAVPFRSRTQLLEALKACAESREDPQLITTGRVTPGKGRQVFVYPGQGAQAFNAARTLVTYPAFADKLAACDRLFREWDDCSVWELLVKGRRDIAIEDAFLFPGQASFFSFQVATTALMRSWGLIPSAVLGQSLGEVAAAHTAGILSLSDAARIVRYRSLLMARTVGRGETAVIGLSPAEARKRLVGLADGLCVAGTIGPETTLVSGSGEALSSLLNDLERENVFCKLLPGRLAAHSPQMEALHDELEGRLSGIRSARATIPFYSTVLARECAGPELDASYWADNLSRPFDLPATVLAAVSDRDQTVVEVGPHPALSPAIEATLKEANLPSAVVSVRRRDDPSFTLKALARLYAHGSPIAWRNVFTGGERRVADCPLYPWQRKRYWFTDRRLESRETVETHADVPRPGTSRVVIPKVVRDWMEPSAELTMLGQWSTDLGAPEHSYLADHVVHGVVVVPAVTYLTFALRAATETYGAPVALTDVTLRKALFLPTDERPVLHAFVAGLSSGTLRFYVASSSKDETSEWEIHVTGTIEAPHDEVWERYAAPPSSIQSGLSPAQPESLYEVLRRVGIDLGPTFRGLDQFWLDEHESLGRITLPDSIGEGAGAYLIHPAQLDACWANGFAGASPELLDSASGEAFLPVRIKRVEALAAAGPQVWSHCKTATRSDGFDVSVVITAEDGRALMRMEGAQFRRLGVTTQDPSRRGLGKASLHVSMTWDEVDIQEGALAEPGAWAIVAEPSAVGAALSELLTQAGHRAFTLPPSEVAGDGAWVRQAGGLPLRGMVYLCHLDSPGGFAADALSETAPKECLEILAAARAASQHAGCRLWVVTRGALALASERNSPRAAMLWGFARAVSAEAPESIAALVDLDPDGADAVADARALREWLFSGAAPRQLARRGRIWLGPRLVESSGHVLRRREDDAPAIRSDATYLITGGLGGVGLAMAVWLVRRGARRLILANRTALPDRRLWDGGDLSPVVANQIAAVRELEAQGATIVLASLDVGDRSALAAHLEEWGRSLPPLRGIVHAAGIRAHVLGANLSATDLADAFHAKVLGAIHLHEASSDLPLDFFLLCSSVLGVTGSRGQAPYCAANSFLIGLAELRRQMGMPACAVSWGLWEVGGMVTAEDRRFLAAQGILPMTTDEALAALDATFARKNAHEIVARFDVSTLARAFEDTLTGDAIASMRPSGPTEPDSRSPRSASRVHQEIIAATAEARGPMVLEYLRQRFARIAECSPAELPVDCSLRSLGFDSIMAAQARNALELELGVKVSMVTLLQGPTIAELGQLVVTELSGAAASAERRDHPGMERLALKGDPERLHEPFPLTDVQYAYWIGRQGSFEISNIPTHYYLELDGALDPERLDRAWNSMLELHPMLRAEFLDSAEQRILARPAKPYHIQVVDLRDHPEQEREGRIEEVRRRMSGGAPSLDCWPHFEIVLHLLPGGRTRLHFNIDMLIVDALSISLLFDYWGRLYADPTAATRIDVSFRDYVLAEHDLLTSGAGKASQEYWRERAATLPMPPELPRALGVSSSVLRDPTFSHRFGEITATDWQCLKQKAQEKGITAASVLAAAFAETLSLWSAEPRFTINTTLFRRFPLHPQVNDIIGDFTSTLLLGLDWSAAGSFEERARRCNEQLWRDMDHPYVSGVAVLRQMSQARGVPILNPIVFTCALGDLGGAIDWAGDLAYHATETSQVALDNRIQEYRGSLLVSWDTLDELYPPGLVGAMHDSYCNLLRRLARDDTAWRSDGLRQLPAVQEEARRAANTTTGEAPKGLLQSLVLHAAPRQPERIAIISEDRTLTYGQLLAQTAALASALRRVGAARNAPIAVVTHAGCDRVIAPLGVLEAGAPYVPIDPDLPTERLQVMMADAGVRIAVTTSDLDASLTWPESVRRVLVDRLEPASAEAVGDRPLQSPTDTAYIIYTSGSTGRPKGVAIDHQGPLNTIVDINERFAIGPDDRVLALSNLSFDLSVYDIFGVLGAGGTLVYPPVSRLRDPVAWAEAVERHSVTLWNTVPLLYSELVEAAAETRSSLASLRLVLLSGDWIPLDLPRRSRALNPTAQLISLGGATEASIWSIFYPIGDIDPAWRSVPYGKPLRNQRFHVLDAELNPCPDWVEGDLYIAGLGLAQGYWRDEERTKASFFTHPRTGERLYRTGDRGRYFPDGNIEFLGRKDSQVKIRGFRVELGDVENNLRQHPDVRDCYVLLRPIREAAGASARSESARQVLVAYVVAAPDKTPTEEPLLAFLKERLPDYMVPSRIVVVDQIPKSPNGKVDRRALPDPIASSLDGQATNVPPSTDTERAIAAIWSEVLDLPVAELGVYDGFFDLGGNSLLLARVYRKLTAAFPDRQIQVVQLFEHQTIARLGRLMDGEQLTVQLDLNRIKALVERRRKMVRGLAGNLEQPSASASA